MSEILLINIGGIDRPGVTHALTSILAEHDVRILDIGQAVIHENLSLGMLVQLPEGAASFEVLKKLLYEAHRMALTIRFTPIESDRYEEWVGQQVQERTVVTLLGRSIEAETLAKVSRVLLDQQLNIEKISRLTQRMPLSLPEEEARACIEFSILGSPVNSAQMRDQLMAVALDEMVDISVQADDMYRRSRRLVVFDMDSTLISCEVIDELAKMAGVGDQVSKITERAMRGELDFQESFRARLSLLKGLPYSRTQEFSERLPLMEGAERLISTLKSLGYKTAICSGGFTLFGEKLQESLGIDYVHANQLEVENGVLTGRVKGDIVDGQRKALLMREIAEQLGLSLRQVVAVGDGANDLPMIQQAGLGIAFRAKPLVRAGAKHALSVLGLDGVLYLIGVRDRDLLASRR